MSEILHCAERWTQQAPYSFRGISMRYIAIYKTGVIIEVVHANEETAKQYIQTPMIGFILSEKGDVGQAITADGDFEDAWDLYYQVCPKAKAESVDPIK